MRRKLIIDGNAVYEIDDECILRKERQLERAERYQESARQTLSDASGGKESQRRRACHEDGSKVGRSQDIHFCGKK